MRCFLAMRLASFSRKKAARARCSRGGASMCEVRSGCAKVERGACGPRWHGCSFVSYAAATPPGDSMHISHNLARGPPSSEIAISHISRDLPHAYLPQSRPGTTVPGDFNLAYLARSPTCTSPTISPGDHRPRRLQSHPIKNLSFCAGPTNVHQPWPLGPLSVSQSVSQFQDFDVTVRRWEVKKRCLADFTPLSVGCNGCNGRVGGGKKVSCRLYATVRRM